MIYILVLQGGRSRGKVHVGFHPIYLSFFLSNFSILIFDLPTCKKWHLGNYSVDLNISTGIHFDHLCAQGNTAKKVSQGMFSVWKCLRFDMLNGMLSFLLQSILVLTLVPSNNASVTDFKQVSVSVTPHFTRSP